MNWFKNNYVLTNSKMKKMKKMKKIIPKKKENQQRTKSQRNKFIKKGANKTGFIKDHLPKLQ